MACSWCEFKVAQGDTPESFAAHVCREHPEELAEKVDQIRKSREKRANSQP